MRERTTVFFQWQCREVKSPNLKTIYWRGFYGGGIYRTVHTGGMHHMVHTGGTGVDEQLLLLTPSGPLVSLTF